MQKKRQTYTKPRIPVKLTEDQFNEFILRHLPTRKRGPGYKISDFKIFNYILYFLHTDCQWKMLPIAPDQKRSAPRNLDQSLREFSV